LGDLFPSQLAGLLSGFLGMLIGSLAPQLIPHENASHRRHRGIESAN